jgi:hypothetical protein
MDTKATFPLNSPLRAALTAACQALVADGATAASFENFESFNAWGNAKGLQDLVAVYEYLSKPTLTYVEVIESYREILLANPGKALKSGDGIYAVLTLYKGKAFVTGVHSESDSVITDEVAEEYSFDFDASAFSDAGGWDGMTQEETLLEILCPEFINGPALPAGVK